MENSLLLLIEGHRVDEAVFSLKAKYIFWFLSFLFYLRGVLMAQWIRHMPLVWETPLWDTNVSLRKTLYT